MKNKRIIKRTGRTCPLCVGTGTLLIPMLPVGMMSIICNGCYGTGEECYVEESQ